MDIKGVADKIWDGLAMMADKKQYQALGQIFQAGREKTGQALEFLRPKSDEEARKNLMVKFGDTYVDPNFAGTLEKVGTKAAKAVAPKAKQLTTKFLDYIGEKLKKNPLAELSRQEITDFAKRPELKKGEADLLNRLGSEIKEGKIAAQEFADSIRRDLLELKPVKVQSPQYGNVNIEREIPDYSQYGADADAMAKAKLKGRNYEEVVFESPITTNGSSHYPNSKNYFAHARGDEVVEGGKKIWREQEIQSDALQKEGIDNMLREKLQKSLDGKITGDQYAKYEQDVQTKLNPFTNDRFGERIMRERIKEKAQKGYSKYRLPTGETIGKIEGFESPLFNIADPRGAPFSGDRLTNETMRVGLEVTGNGDKWIITDILGDGRFKAIQKVDYDNFVADGISPYKIAKMDTWNETFDLTGKSNPQYRRYENWGKFLKNKYGGKEVVDPQGNSWIEIDLKPEYKKMPIEAFGAFMLQNYLLPPEGERGGNNDNKNSD